MDPQHDISVLSRALTGGLISFEQYSQILREMTTDRHLTAQSLLLSRVGLSRDQLDSLEASTAGDNMAVTRELTGEHDSSGLSSVEMTDLSDPHPTTDAGPPAGPHALPTRGEETDEDSISQQQWARAMQLHARLRYDVKGEVARGGLGRVVRARDQQIGRDVAVKEMLPKKVQSAERIERFLLEAQVTGQLEHPGIVPIYAIGVGPSGRPFYTMKLIGGRTLATLIKEFHRLDHNSPPWTPRLHELLRALVDVCHAVAYAHSRGVLHRDIKPPNIMVGDFGETLVVDWGLAKVCRGPATGESPGEAAAGSDPGEPSTDSVAGTGIGRRSTATTVGAVIGTIPYMSPEQATGDVERLDPRADIFCLGATLYEILVGHPPYVGDREDLIERARLAHFAPPRRGLPHLPAALEAICLKAMARNPDDRYATAKTMADDVNRFLSGEPVEAYPEPWWQRAQRWARRHRVACAAAAAALLALAVAAGVGREMRTRKIDSVETGARALLHEGQTAFNDADWPTAADRFRQAQGQASTEASLGQLQALIDQWVVHTQQRIDAQADQRLAAENRAKLNQLRDDAFFYGMLAAGRKPRQYAQRTRQAVTEALALFSLSPDRPGEPRLDGELYDEQQAAEVTRACLELRMVLADAEGRPHPSRTPEENQRAALAGLELLSAIDPGRHRFKSFHLRRALYLLWAGDAAGSDQARDKAAATPPAGAEDHFFLGDFHYLQQQYTTAMKHYQAALREEPNHFWAMYFLGDCQLRAGRPLDAVATLTAAHSLRPRGFTYVYLLRGLAYGRMGDIDSAEREFEQAAQRSPREYGLFIMRGEVAVIDAAINKNRLRLDDARRDYEQAVKLEPKVTDAYVNLAEIARLQGDLDEAKRRLDQALEVARDTVTGSALAHRERARIYLQRGELAAAQEDINWAVAEAPHGSLLMASVRAEQGRLAHRQGKYDDAITNYDQILKSRPDYYLANMLKGLALQEQKKYKEAIAQFTRFLNDSPLVLEAYRPGAGGPHRAAVSLDWLSGGDGALPTTTEPRQLVAAVYRDRGFAHLLLGQRSAALDDFARAAELFPDAAELPESLRYDRMQFASMRAHRGMAYLTGYAELAIEQFRATLKLKPDDLTALAGMSYAYAVGGDHAAADRHAGEALAAAEKSGSREPGVRYNVAAAYALSYAAVRDDPKRPDRDALMARYLARAADQLKDCLRLAADETTREFYRGQALRDRAFDPIRDSDPFQKALAAR